MRLSQFATRFDSYSTIQVSCNSQKIASLVYQHALPVVLGLLMCSGCANVQEKRTITAFQTGLEAGNLQALRENSSEHFAAKALRHPQADDALTQLKLPEGKFEILDVEDISKTEKKVTVGFGKEKKRKIMYRLLSEGKKKQWKVDDIYLRQRKGKKVIVMPITDQMDVLLSAREFFDSWTTGDRQRVLASSSPKLREALEKLPPSVLAYNISLMIGKTARTKSFRPEAHINGDKAVVKLNRSHGTIQISMKQNETGWQVSDLALTGRDENSRIASLLNRVEITNRAMVFLDAWQQSDKAKLKQVTFDKFYTAGLAPARLSDVPLPSSFEVEGKVDVKLSDSRADVILNDQKQTLQMTLKQDGDNSGEYFVADVTLYDMKQEQTLSLISALTARPVAELFISALAQRDVKMLQYNTTRDFHGKTWSRASKQTLAILPMPVQNLSTARITETKFDGEITRVLFAAGPDQLTVVLHDQGGRVLVDDVLIDRKDDTELAQQLSLKDHLAAIVPVYELAASIHNDQPRQTVRLVTDDFYSRVFSMTQTMPETAYTYLSHVSASQPEIQFPESNRHSRAKEKSKKGTRNLVIEFDTSDKQETLVTFSGDNSVMHVSLIEEDGLLRINDALINTPNSEVAQRLKQEMRMELADRRAQRGIRMVSGESRSEPEKRKHASSRKTRPESNSIKTAQSNPAGLSSREPAINNRANKPLKNALYEQYEAARPVQQIKQAEFSPGLLPATTTKSQTNKMVSPPRQHQFENHLLLQPIPIQEKE